MSEAVFCPKCASTQIHAEKRGWSIWSGLIGSGKIRITCLKCGYQFAPGGCPVGAERFLNKLSSVIEGTEIERAANVAIEEYRQRFSGNDSYVRANLIRGIASKSQSLEDFQSRMVAFRNSNMG